MGIRSGKTQHYLPAIRRAVSVDFSPSLSVDAERGRLQVTFTCSDSEYQEEREKR
jgi:hypothetical protein